MPDESVFEIDGEGMDTCPAAVLDSETSEGLDMWAWMKRGFLPKPGGIDDQEERDLQVIEIIESVELRARSKE